MVKITPHVFISATSDDLRSARQVVKNALITEGCYPIVQEHFEPDYRTVAEMIRGRIQECDALVHLIGKRYGGEPSPESLPPGTQRRSWTQLEYHIAKEMGMKTFLFICDENYPFDEPRGPEPQDELDLQAEYRKWIRSGDQLYVIVKNPQELALRIAEMKLQVNELKLEVERSRDQLTDALDTMERHSAEMHSGQRHIMASLEDLSHSFTDLNQAGGIITEPVTPEQYYHNARLYEMRGDYGNARRQYISYFGFGLDFIDPHLRFQQFLKVLEGREGAKETYQYLSNQSKSSVFRLAYALLHQREMRVKSISGFLQGHQDFGPAYYLLSHDFSVNRLGSQTLSDKRREKQLLEKFLELYDRGKVTRWILDQSEITEWRDDAMSRLAILQNSQYAIENPIDVHWMRHNTGWSGTIQIAEPAGEIFWKKAGDPNFTSTGISQYRCYSTGLPQPNPNIELPLGFPMGQLEVKYRDVNGNEMGPFSVPFDPMEETIAQGKNILSVTKTGWLSFRDYDDKVLLYFTHLISYQNAIAAIHYGLNIGTPDKEHPINESDPVYYIEVPADTKFASVIVTFKDQTQSELVTIQRPV